MKLTINIDDTLLDNVVRITGAATKTEAITTALREVERKAKLVEVLRAGTGASPAELRTMFDPASDPMMMRAAETPATYHVKTHKEG